MQMHDTVGLSGKPFPEFGTPVRQPQIVLMQNADSIGPGLLDTEIGLCRPRFQIATALRSDEQLVGKALDDLQARVNRASVYDNYFNSVVLLIRDRLERSGEPTLSVVGRNDHRKPG